MRSRARAADKLSNGPELPGPPGGAGELAPVKSADAWTEQSARRTPWHSLLLAYLAMVPPALCAILAWGVPPQSGADFLRFGILWCGALLCFFAGVSRGLSFRQPGGPSFGQLAGLCLFVLGVFALACPAPAMALLALLAGFGFLQLHDPDAAEAGEAPRYFSRLRPVQMLIPLVSVFLLLLRLPYLD